MEYISDKDKTYGWSDGLYVNTKNAFERMRIVKQFYNKEDGRSYIHFTISFKGRRDKNVLYDFAEAVVSNFNDFQCLFAIHQNTANYHIHFVLNSVSFTDGHKFSQSQADMENFKIYISNMERYFNLDTGEVTLSECYDSELDIDDSENNDANDKYPPGFNYAAFEKYKAEIPDFDTLEELVCPLIFYEDDKEIIEPLIFYKKPKEKNPDFDTPEELVCPLIFYENGKELIEPLIFYKKPKGEKNND